jgi:hypothetical protein
MKIRHHLCQFLIKININFPILKDYLLKLQIQVISYIIIKIIIFYIFQLLILCFLLDLQNINVTQQNITTMQHNVPAQSILHSVTLHLKKKSPFKENIHVTNGMTFANLINFVFPAGPSKDKQFIFKSSLETGGKQFLPEQIIHDIFYEEHADVWRNNFKL